MTPAPRARIGPGGGDHIYIYIYIDNKVENIAFIMNTCIIVIVIRYTYIMICISLSLSLSPYICICVGIGTEMTNFLCCFSKAVIVFAVQFPRWQHRCAYPFWAMTAHRQISQTPRVFHLWPAWVLSQRVDSLRRYNPCNLAKKPKNFQASQAVAQVALKPRYRRNDAALRKRGFRWFGSPSWGRRCMAGAVSLLWLVTLPLTRCERMLDSTGHFYEPIQCGRC